MNVTSAEAIEFAKLKASVVCSHDRNMCKVAGINQRLFSYQVCFNLVNKYKVRALYIVIIFFYGYYIPIRVYVILILYISVAVRKNSCGG